jgi:hypothetical protein
MGKAHLRLVTPITERRTVPQEGPPNDRLRTREYLTARPTPSGAHGGSKGSRHGYRDATMALGAYRQGLRASELVDLMVVGWA